jgi:manganese transport protein
MGGFINRKIPLFLRRGLTMIPALVVIAVGMNPTNALVLSQVVLSFGIPIALIPLVILTSRRDIMGVHVNGRILMISAWAIAAAISAMNIFLIYQQFFMS